MSKTTKESTEDKFENVEQVLTQSEHFIEKYQKQITIAMIAVMVIVAGYYGIKRWHFQPQEAEAQANIMFAQQYFEADSFQLALDGDGPKLGFLDIIEDYSFTNSSNLSKYYAGICYLHLGEFNKAIDYLKDYSGDDEMIKYIALGAIGDAYLELGNKDKALSYYESASEGNNEFTDPTYLMKLGLLQEEMGDYGDAIETYTEIKDKYKTSSEGRQIEKYITRAMLLAKK